MNILFIHSVVLFLGVGEYSFTRPTYKSHIFIYICAFAHDKNLTK